MKFKEIIAGTAEERRAAETVAELEARADNNKRLKAREMKKLIEAKQISGRRTVRRAAAAIVAGSVVAIGTAAGLGASNSSESNRKVDKHPQPHNTPGLTTATVPGSANAQTLGSFSLRIKNPAFFGPERVQQINDAANKWDQRFHCDRPVLVKPYSSSEQHIPGSGVTKKTLEIATSGVIQLGRDGSAYDTTLHAMTHACKPAQPTVLKTPIPLDKGEGVVLGYQGLVLNVRLNSGRLTNFTPLEESQAERNAATVSPDYTVPNLGYNLAGKHNIQQIPASVYPESEEWTKTNNVPAFVNAELGHPADTPITEHDLGQVMDVYNNLFYHSEG